MEEFSVVAEAFGEVLFVEAGNERGVVEISLAYEFWGGVEEGFFFPVDGDLGFVFLGRRAWT
jgi:hypothetical protein